MVVGHLSEIFVSFQGEGVHAGRRHLFVRLAGCNLRCRYCDTPESLERVPGFIVHDRAGARHFRNPVTSEELLKYAEPLLLDRGPCDGTALTGGEPLLQADFLAELLMAGKVPRPVLLETSGVLSERLPTLLPYVDIVSMDVKIPSNTGEPAFWAEHRRFLSLAGDKAYVKILVDRQTTNRDLAAAANLVGTTAPHAPVFLQPITNPDGQVDVDQETLDQSFSILREHLDDVRVLPQAHKMLRVR